MNEPIFVCDIVPRIIGGRVSGGRAAAGASGAAGVQEAPSWRDDVSKRVCVRVTRTSMPALKIVCKSVRDGVWCLVGQTSAHIKCKQEGDNALKVQT